MLLVGLGGSATNDAGVGMASALGWKFLDAANNTLAPSPAEFRKISKILPPGRPLSCRVTGLCDVNNPLLGDAGATRTFGPQKGASPEMLATLEESLAHVARLCSEQFGKDLSLVPGPAPLGDSVLACSRSCRRRWNLVSMRSHACGFGEPGRWRQILLSLAKDGWTLSRSKARPHSKSPNWRSGTASRLSGSPASSKVSFPALTPASRSQTDH